MSLIVLPMQLSIVFSLLTIILNFSLQLFIILTLHLLLNLAITNLLFKSVSNMGSIIFDLRSLQTDILSRLIDNYLDVKFPHSSKAYKELFNKTTYKLRNIEAIIATIPKALKSFLELILILMIGVYIIYNLYILDLPVDKFIGSSAAIILSLLKLTPIFIWHFINIFNF